MLWDMKLEAPHLAKGGTAQSFRLSPLCAVQMVDLDFLPLGDRKKGHCRLRAAFKMSDESPISLAKDIPKSTIFGPNGLDFISIPRELNNLR
jgi:hypothetical protein